MSLSTEGNLSIGNNQKPAVQLDSTIPMNETKVPSRILNFQDGIKIEKLQASSHSGDTVHNDAMNFLENFKYFLRCNCEKLTVPDSTAKDDEIEDKENKAKKCKKNGKCYPTVETKKEWLSTILDTTDHEQMIKAGIESKSEFVPNLPSLYRRQLDEEHCVSLNTEFGRHLLASTLHKGKHANIYYTLSQQFHTQSNSMNCGPSSLVYVLNSLNVDPGKQWRYPWRWYDEDVLNRCTPVEYTQSVGCSFDMLICMARNNGVSVDVVRASKDWTLEDFRNDVKQSCASFDQPILMSFSRKTLKQIGSGHFSPIGAYNEEHDMVLVMEIARFKYPPFWTKLSKMWEALQNIAVPSGMKETSGMPRGYLIVRKINEGESPSSRLRLPWQQASFQMKVLSNDNKVMRTMHIMKKSKKVWRTWLDQNADEPDSLAKRGILIQAIDKIVEITKEVDPPPYGKVKNVSRKSLSRFNLTGVGNTSLFQVIKQRLQGMPTLELDRLKNTVTQLLDLVDMPEQAAPTDNLSDCQNNEGGNTDESHINALDSHEELNKVSEILTAMILFWPYAMEAPNSESTTNQSQIQAAIERDMIHFPYSTQRSVPEQLNTILKSIDHVGHEVIYGEKSLDV